MPNQNEDIKEEFCGACALVPLAFAGAGATAYGSSSKGSAKKTRKIIFWTGLATGILSLIMIIVMVKRNNCKECA